MAVIAATVEGVHGEHVTVPLAGQSWARLVFPRSVAGMHLTAGGTDALFEGRFRPPFPTVRAEGEVVTVEFPRGWGFLRRPRPTTITLHPQVTWDIEMRGGNYIVADLSKGDLASFVVRGATYLDLVLGHPHGLRTVETGGVSKLSIRRPADVPLRVQVVGGVSKFAADDEYFGAVGGGLTWLSDGYANAVDRYEVVISSASTVRIERLPAR